MHPVLFQFGTFVFETRVVFIVLGLVLAAFTYWRRGAEEHFDELQFFDGFLQSIVVGVVVARLSYVLLNFDQFTTSWFTWANPVAAPGFLLLPGMVGAGWRVYQHARSKKWDAFQVLDFWIVSALFGLAFFELGNLVQGSGFGIEVSSNFGVRVATEGGKELLPAPLILAWLLFLSVVYLYWVEYRYRTIGWYRGTLQSAQAGFVLASSMIVVGILYAAVSSLRRGAILVMGVELDRYLYGLLAAIGIYLLLSRSGIHWQKLKDRVLRRNRADS